MQAVICSRRLDQNNRRIVYNSIANDDHRSSGFIRSWTSFRLSSIYSVGPWPFNVRQIVLSLYSGFTSIRNLLFSVNTKGLLGITTSSIKYHEYTLDWHFSCNLNGSLTSPNLVGKADACFCNAFQALKGYLAAFVLVNIRESERLIIQANVMFAYNCSEYINNIWTMSRCYCSALIHYDDGICLSHLGQNIIEELPIICDLWSIVDTTLLQHYAWLHIYRNVGCKVHVFGSSFSIARWSPYQ